jgi:hypothetical protein
MENDDELGPDAERGQPFRRSKANEEESADTWFYPDHRTTLPWSETIWGRGIWGIKLATTYVDERPEEPYQLYLVRPARSSYAPLLVDHLGYSQRDWLMCLVRLLKIHYAWRASAQARHENGRRRDVLSVVTLTSSVTGTWVFLFLHPCRYYLPSSIEAHQSEI